MRKVNFLEGLRKTISYRNKQYLIEYNYETERRINGNTTHSVKILKVNNNEPYINFEKSFVSIDNDQISLIGLCKKTINDYEESVRPKFSYLDEFTNWDGKLDGWDE